MSIEPYPTPNIIQQDIRNILNSVSFVDRIIFGRLNYNVMVPRYPNYKKNFKEVSNHVVEFCKENNKEYYIKKASEMKAVILTHDTDFLKKAAKKILDITVDELKTIIHEVIAEDLESWRETFEIMADKRLMAQIKKADKFSYLGYFS